MPKPTESDIMTARETAQLLGVSYDNVVRLVSRGKMPGRKVGKEYRFSRASVLGWLAGSSVRTAS